MQDTPHQPEAAVLALVKQFQHARQRHDRAQAVDAVRQLVALRAPMGPQWQQMAQAVAADGEIGLARQAMDLFVESEQDDPAALYQKAGLLADLGLWEDAAGLLATIPSDVPDPMSHAYSRGTAAMYCGAAKLARQKLEEVTAGNPRLGSAWLSLATLVNFAHEPELTDRVLAAEKPMQNAAPSQRAIYYYALGKAYADRDEHDLAAKAFFGGAQHMQPTLSYSRERDVMFATDAVEGYSAENIQDIASRQSEPTGRTIFVTGLPRSGTTLLEQILTNHSAVSGGGEINRLSLFIKEVDGLIYPALADYARRAGTADAAHLWKHWMEERFPTPGRVVDKTNNTSRMIGLAAALLPEAPLIWITRDPLDCAWSCLRTCFMNAQPWSYDLKDIAFHFRLEDQLLDRWKNILGDRLLVVPYEELVTSSSDWIGRILRHCGLPEEDQVFAPHENRRAVTTSSVMQVRNPINTRSIGAAQPYRKFLAPFIEAYFD